MIALWMLALVGCELPQSSSNTEGVVECRGLTHQNLVWRTARSALLGYDAENDLSVPRCQLMLSQTLTGADVQLNFANFLDLDTLPDTGTGWLYADGTYWIIDSGTMSFDTYDDTLAEGSYSFQASAIDASNSRTGRTATFEGPFSWCEGRRDDCPFRFESGLEKTATIDTPVLAETEAGLTACRMLVDPATEALQVDLQIGTWDGDNVGQLWSNECGQFGLIPPQGNLFRFRSGGVTGPGTYGPLTSYTVDGVQLPSLEFAHPATFYGGVNQLQACTNLYFYQSTVATLDGASSCSFTVDDQQGRFELACTSVNHTGAYPWPNTTGDFTMSADCDYVER